MISHSSVSRKIVRPALLAGLGLMAGMQGVSAGAQTAHAGGLFPAINDTAYNFSSGLAVDKSGNVYYIDYTTSTLKQVLATGGVVAPGSTPVTLTAVASPNGVAVDNKGDVFFTDGAVLKELVAADGVVSTSSQLIAVTTLPQTPSMMAFDPAGNLFLVNLGSGLNTGSLQKLVAVDGELSQGGNPETIASGFGNPGNIAIDRSGNVFLTDQTNKVVLKFKALGGAVTTESTYETLFPVSNTGTALAFDEAGNLLVADPGPNVGSIATVTRYAPVNGEVSASSPSVSMSTGFATSIIFNIAAGPGGNIFLIRNGPKSVWELNSGSHRFPPTQVGHSVTAPVVFTFDSVGTLASVPFALLTQGAQNLDYILAGDQRTDLCQPGHTYAVGETCTVNVTFSPTQPFLRMGAVQLMGSEGTPIATYRLSGTGVGPAVVFPDSTSVKSLAETGSQALAGVAVTGNGTIYVADAAAGTVKKISAGSDSNGRPNIETVLSGLSLPSGLAVDGSGNLYVADTGDGVVKEMMAVNGVVSATSPVQTLAIATSSPKAVAVDASGNVFVGDGTGSVKRWDAATSTTTTFTGFTVPQSVAVDESGNVFVADSGAGTVKEIVAQNGAVSADSTVRTVGGEFASPTGLAVDGNGNVFVVDQAEGKVKRIVAENGSVSSSSVVTTVASGFSNPIAMALTAAGDMYVVSFEDTNVKEVVRSAPSTLSFDSTGVGSSSAKSIRLENVGNAALVPTVPAPLSTNPAMSGPFMVDSSSTCQQPSESPSTTLDAATSCTYTINFVPSEVGITTGSLDLLVNQVGGSLSIPLECEGIIPVDHFAFTAAPPSKTKAGEQFDVTVTAYADAASTIATSYAGPVKITSSDSEAVLPTGTLNLTAGVGTFHVTLKTAGTQTITVADNGGNPSVKSGDISVTAASVANVATVSGSNQNVAIGSQFAQPLLVRVTDAYSNVINGAVVTFTVPTTGASASLSSNGTCTTGVDGTCSVTATANGVVSATAYSVTASVADVSTPATFLLTNQKAATAISTSSVAKTVQYGEPVTLSAAIAPASAGGTAATGSMKFLEGSAQVGTASLTNGAASIDLPVLSVGLHQYGAAYLGDENFNSASPASILTLTVNKAASTLSVATTQPIVVPYAQAGSVTVSVAGPYSREGVSKPTGSLNYFIRNSDPGVTVSSGSPTIVDGAVTIPVPSVLSPGSYTLSVSYEGDANYAGATPLGPVQIQIGQLQPVIAWTQPSAITYGTPLANVLTAVAQDQSGSSSVAVAGTYSYLNGTAAVTSSSVLPAGSYTLAVNFTPADAAKYKAATGSVSLVVKKATPAVSLQSSGSSVLVQNPVTLTATVSSQVSTPTGTVQFLDGTTAVGSSPLVNGVATLSTSSLAVGTHSITAVYAGDANFVTQTTTATSVAVNDFNLTISASSTPGSATSQTVLPGGQAVYHFTIAPTGSTTFPAKVDLTVSGLPAGATYAISPTSIAAGAGPTDVTLTIDVPKQLAMVKTAAPFALALLLLPFSGRMRRKAGSLGRFVAMVLLLVGGAAGVATLSGCGANTGYFAHPQQTYNVTITGTSGSLSHSTTVTLTVQ